VRGQGQEQSYEDDAGSNRMNCKTASPGATNGNRAASFGKHEGIGMASFVTDRVATRCRLITVSPDTKSCLGYRRSACHIDHWITGEMNASDVHRRQEGEGDGHDEHQYERAEKEDNARDTEGARHDYSLRGE